MNEPTISFTGNVAFDPKLRITPNGAHVLDLRVATTPRIRKGEDWEDGGTLWYDVVCWNRLADNVLDSVRKGDSVVVTGRLLNRVWDKPDIETGVVTKVDKLTVDATHLGLDLSRYAATVIRPPRPEDGVSDRDPSSTYAVDTDVAEVAEAA
ncbi:MAG: single-strand binding protein [Frankiales bacterium]|nr:single-strand binding protein [Frankiales bacterium]